MGLTLWGIVTHNYPVGITYLTGSQGDYLMTRQEEFIVLGTYFTAVLLLWTPVFIDTIRQERKLNKRGRK